MKVVVFLMLFMIVAGFFILGLAGVGQSMAGASQPADFQLAVSNDPFSQEAHAQATGLMAQAQQTGTASVIQALAIQATAEAHAIRATWEAEALAQMKADSRTATARADSIDQTATARADILSTQQAQSTQQAIRSTQQAQSTQMALVFSMTQDAITAQETKTALSIQQAQNEMELAQARGKATNLVWAFFWVMAGAVALALVAMVIFQLSRVRVIHRDAMGRKPAGVFIDGKWLDPGLTEVPLMPIYGKLPDPSPTQVRVKQIDQLTDLASSLPPGQSLEALGQLSAPEVPQPISGTVVIIDPAQVKPWIEEVEYKLLEG